MVPIDHKITIFLYICSTAVFGLIQPYFCQDAIPACEWTLYNYLVKVTFTMKFKQVILWLIYCYKYSDKMLTLGLSKFFAFLKR